MHTALSVHNVVMEITALVKAEELSPETAVFCWIDPFSDTKDKKHTLLLLYTALYHEKASLLTGYSLTNRLTYFILICT